MHKKILGLGLLFCLVGFGPLLASSDTFYTQGAWGNTGGGTAGTVSEDGSVWFWGTGNIDKRSSVGFSAVNSFSLDECVSLGQFTFNNKAKEISSFHPDVNAVLHLSLGSGESLLSGRDLAFVVNNRYSTQGVEPDRLTLTAPAEPFTFTLGSYAYTLTLLGFSTDGQNVDATPFTFSVAEGSSATRHLLASVSRATVPIPPTAILLGSGLLGLLGFRRRA